MSDRLDEIETPDATLFDVSEEDYFFPVTGAKRAACEMLIEQKHYTRSIPSGKSHYFYWRGVIVVFSIPANKNIGPFVLKRPCVCWELARLWAKDGHRKNALTEAIAMSIRGLRRAEPDVEVLVSFADPNVGHEGFVYRAASWVFTGQSEESRAYQDGDGQIHPRRSFHSGGRGLTKAEIEQAGYTQVRRQGKYRYAKGMTPKARREIRRLWNAEQH